MVMIYALGDVSGAHLNPAVSVAISLCQQQKWGTTLKYVAAQTLGALAAGLLATHIFGASFQLAPPTTPTQTVSWTQAGVAELLFSCMLCFTVLNTACCNRNAGNQYFGLAISSVIVAGGYAAGPLSGANFNPAISLSIDLCSGKIRWSLAYVGFQLAGSALAALLYRAVRPTEFNKDKKGGGMEKVGVLSLGG